MWCTKWLAELLYNMFFYMQFDESTYQLCHMKVKKYMLFTAFFI